MITISGVRGNHRLLSVKCDRSPIQIISSEKGGGKTHTLAEMTCGVCEGVEQRRVAVVLPNRHMIGNFVHVLDSITTCKFNYRKSEQRFVFESGGIIDLYSVEQGVTVFRGWRYDGIFIDNWDTFDTCCWDSDHTSSTDYLHTVIFSLGARTSNCGLVLSVNDINLARTIREVYGKDLGNPLCQ